MQGPWGQQQRLNGLGQPTTARRLLCNGARQNIRLSANRPSKPGGDQQWPDNAATGSTESHAAAAAAAGAALQPPPSTATPSPSLPPLPSSSAAAAAAAEQDDLQAAVLHAQQELRESWQQLKDAAGVAFAPGYGSKSDSAAGSSTQAASDLNKEQLYRLLLRRKTYRGQLQSAIERSSSSRSSRSNQIISLPDRLKRLLTLEFLKPQQFPKEDGLQKALSTKLAAMQFELNQARQGNDRDPRQAQQQQQPSQEQQGMQPSQGRDPVSSASAAGPMNQQPAGLVSDAAEEAPSFFPATAQVLVLATWAVFTLQWWQALPELWLAVKEGWAGRALLAFLLLFPDNGVTRAVCLDLHSLQSGTSMTGLITSGLIHSGLLATLLNTAALFDAGRCLEAGMGSMQLISTGLMASVCAALGHLVGGSSMLGVGGSGMVVGVYAAWVLQAKQHMQEDINMKELYIAAGVLVLLNLLLGMVQPAVGFASLAGGLLGGVLSVKFGGRVSEALYWGLSGPFMALLLVVRLALDGLKLLVAAGAVAVVVSVRWVLGMVQFVKRM